MSIRPDKFLIPALVLAFVACLAAQSSIVISIAPATTYQTILDWEATAFASEQNSNYSLYRDTLIDKAANDLGITRVRLEVKSGAENTSGTGSGESMINDNSDPFSINPAGFRWAKLDDTITKIVQPLRSALAARGESLYVNLCYVSFNPGAGYVHGSNSDEYAEFMEAAFMHINSTFGWVPDGIEVILEADNTTSGWSGLWVGNAIAATGPRLANHGWHPEFIAPSVTNVDNGVDYLRDALAVAGARPYLKEASYHRYGGVASIPTYTSYAIGQGLRTSQLEWLGADYLTLHDDLTIGRTSVWAEYALAGIGTTADDNGGAYFRIDPTTYQVTWYSRGAVFRQYFRYVRRGAVRLGASSTAASVVDATAFRNVDGKLVVVSRTTSGASWLIRGLPAGTYSISYTTTTSFNQGTLSDVTISAGQDVPVSIPAPGALTVFQRSGGTATPPSPPTNLRIVSN
jgi:Glycosyl hydrolase family 30 beta sandwich domain